MIRYEPAWKLIRINLFFVRFFLSLKGITVLFDFLFVTSHIMLRRELFTRTRNLSSKADKRLRLAQWETMINSDDFMLRLDIPFLSIGYDYDRLGWKIFKRSRTEYWKYLHNGR